MTSQEEHIANIKYGTNFGPYRWNRSDSETMLDDEELKRMSKLHSDMMLNDKNKERWNYLHKEICQKKN
jgi:hypothetical protein